MSDKARKYARLAALIALIAALWVAGSRPQVRAFFEIEHLRQLTAESGVVGMAAFVGIFAGGYLLQVPAMVFVVTALVGWGPLLGGLLAFAGSLIAACINFFALRSVGGTPLADVEHRWVRKLLSQLDDHPIRTVFLLRTLLYLNPVMNLPLVLSGVRFRDYLIGSALGFVVPLTVIILALDTVMRVFGLT